MTLKLQSTSIELRKGLNLAWYHHLTHVACVQKLRGLRQKLDALRVQTGPSHSKYEDFRQKLICFKGSSFFLTYFNSRLFLHPTCNIQSHILKFQPFLTSFAIFMHLIIYFELNDLEIIKHYIRTQKRLKLGMVSSFDPHNICAKVERITQKLDALRVQTRPSLSKYKGLRRKLMCYKDISFS